MLNTTKRIPDHDVLILGASAHTEKSAMIVQPTVASLRFARLRPDSRLCVLHRLGAASLKEPCLNPLSWTGTLQITPFV